MEVDDLWSAARKDSVDDAKLSTTVLGKKEYL